MLFAVGFKSAFLSPHTEKANKIPSWVETALQSSKTTFPRAFRKSVEKFVQLTISGNQFMVFKRRRGKAGCGWLLRLRKRTNPSCLEFSLFSEASVPFREFLWCCLWLLPLWHPKYGQQDFGKLFDGKCGHNICWPPHPAPCSVAGGRNFQHN